MRLEDYINNVKNPPKKEHKTYLVAWELDSFPKISDKKKELIKAAFRQFDDILFEDAEDRYRREASANAAYQTVDENGTKGLSTIKICDLVTSYDLTQAIPEEEFRASYSKVYKVGSQRYLDVTLHTHFSMEEECMNRYAHLTYCSDGNIFLDHQSAWEIERISVDELGNLLARQCVDLENESYRRRHPNEPRKKGAKIIST